MDAPESSGRHGGQLENLTYVSHLDRSLSRTKPYRAPDTRYQVGKTLGLTGAVPIDKDDLPCQPTR